MGKYIALLRGINVGGKNKIAMAELKLAFQDMDFTDVKTYINSGNVVFKSLLEDKNELRKSCETMILERFNLQIPIAIVSALEIEEILETAPEWWDLDKTAVNYIMFLLDGTVDDIFSVMGDIKPDIEQIGHNGKIIYWSAPRETFSKTTYSKIASSSVNDKVTIRNANTVKKLAILLSEI